MKKEMVGFSSVSNDELMNVDGGIIDVLLAVAVVLISSAIRPQKIY